MNKRSWSSGMEEKVGLARESFARVEEGRDAYGLMDGWAAEETGDDGEAGDEEDGVDEVE